MAKKNRPFTDHPKIIDLQVANGLDMGRVLHSNVIATDIIDYIATEMRIKLVNYIKEVKPKISVLIDESTTVSNLSTLIIYLRGLFDNAEEPITIFFGLVELSKATADGIRSDLLNYFESCGLDRLLLQEIWIGICTDGASVMLGKHSDVATLLKEEFKNIVVTWHCLAHRLELAVGDTVAEVTSVNHFKLFLGTL